MKKYTAEDSGGVLEAVVDIRGQSRRLVLLDLTAGGEGGFLRLELKIPKRQVELESFL